MPTTKQLYERWESEMFLNKHLPSKQLPAFTGEEIGRIVYDPINEDLKIIPMIVNTPEETDGFKGLYGEVVEYDTYKLRSLTFQPDVILDLGANIGVFARFARSLFPKALIVSVEPNPENIIHFKKFTDDNNIILIEKAIGTNEMWHCFGAVNGAHECYLSAGLGYDKDAMKQQEGISLEKSLVPMIMPDELIWEWVPVDVKSLIKIDIEGGENAIFTHEPSMKAIATMDYICMEIHWYALTGVEMPEVKQKTLDFIERLKETHDCVLDHVSLWCLKR